MGYNKKNYDTLYRYIIEEIKNQANLFLVKQDLILLFKGFTIGIIEKNEDHERIEDILSLYRESTFEFILEEYINDGSMINIFIELKNTLIGLGAVHVKTLLKEFNGFENLGELIYKIRIGHFDIINKPPTIFESERVVYDNIKIHNINVIPNPFEIYF